MELINWITDRYTAYDYKKGLANGFIAGLVIGILIGLEI